VFNIINGIEQALRAVMAGLVPAIHVLVPQQKVVDARHKAGHDRILLAILRATPDSNRKDSP
jgi:hypothetical protein